jgi:hypothetical protein
MRAPIAVVSLLALGLVGCAHRQPDRVVHTTSMTEAYRDIELSGAFEVELVVGPEASVELSGDDKAIEQVRVLASGERLEIETKGPRPLTGQVHVRITTPEIHSIEVNGAAGLTVAGLKTGSLEIELNGAGSTKAEGSLESLQLEMNGAGSFDAPDLVAHRVDLEINGAGSATVHAEESLHASLHGVGSVRYAGHPQSIDKEVHGVGTIQPL